MSPNSTSLQGIERVSIACIVRYFGLAIIAIAALQRHRFKFRAYSGRTILLAVTLAFQAHAFVSSLAGQARRKLMAGVGCVGYFPFKNS